MIREDGEDRQEHHRSDYREQDLHDVVAEGYEVVAEVVLLVLGLVQKREEDAGLQ